MPRGPQKKPTRGLPTHIGMPPLEEGWSDSIGTKRVTGKRLLVFADDKEGMKEAVAHYNGLEYRASGIPVVASKKDAPPPPLSAVWNEASLQTVLDEYKPDVVLARDNNASGMDGHMIARYCADHDVFAVLQSDRYATAIDFPLEDAQKARARYTLAGRDDSLGGKEAKPGERDYIDRQFQRHLQSALQR